MRIRAIDKIPVRVPIRPEFRIQGSLGAHLESPFLILKVHTDEGVTGLGEISCTPIWSGENSTTASHIISSFLEPAILGQNPTDIELLTAKMRRAVAGHPFTKSGIEIALWDILGKIAGLPVYRLLGGVVRRRIPIKMSISGAAPERAAELARWAVGQGLNTAKVKVGLEPEGDVARVRAVRDAVGSAFRLGVDANGGWSPRVAIQTVRRMAAESNIYFAEQPVAPLDVQWMADVRRSVPVPVMADESCYSLQDAMACAPALPTFYLFTWEKAAALGRRARSRALRKPRDSHARWEATSSLGSPVPRWRTSPRPPPESEPKNSPAIFLALWLMSTIC